MLAPEEGEERIGRVPRHEAARPLRPLGEELAQAGIAAGATTNVADEVGGPDLLDPGDVEHDQRPLPVDVEAVERGEEPHHEGDHDDPEQALDHGDQKEVKDRHARPAIVIGDEGRELI